jgi:hypothetical protein
MDKQPTFVFNREYGVDAKGADAGKYPTQDDVATHDAFTDMMVLHLVRPVGETPAYTLIRSWLGQCDKEHEQCQPEGNAEKLKTICLIDVRLRRLVPYRPGSQYEKLLSLESGYI